MGRYDLKKSFPKKKYSNNKTFMISKKISIVKKSLETDLFFKFL